MSSGASEIAKRIAKGHARNKHWLNLTEDELAKKINDILENFR